MRDPSADDMAEIRRLTAAFPAPIARLALRSDAPAETARNLIDGELKAIAFHVERALRHTKP